MTVLRLTNLCELVEGLLPQDETTHILEITVKANRHGKGVLIEFATVESNGKMIHAIGSPFDPDAKPKAH